MVPATQITYVLTFPNGLPCELLFSPGNCLSAALNGPTRRVSSTGRNSVRRVWKSSECVRQKTALLRYYYYYLSDYFRQVSCSSSWKKQNLDGGKTWMPSTKWEEIPQTICHSMNQSVFQIVKVNIGFQLKKLFYITHKIFWLCSSSSSRLFWDDKRYIES